MPDAYIEDLTSGVDELPSDTLFLQRRINGVWTEYRTTPEFYYGTAMGIKTLNLTQADFTAGVYGITITVPAGKSIIPMIAYGYATRTTPQTGVLPDALEIKYTGAGSCRIGADIADDATQYGVLLTLEGGSDLLGQTGTALNLTASAAWMASNFTLLLRIQYVLLDILPPG